MQKERGIFVSYYLAIDIGASSGRHIVGWQEEGRLQTEEVYRFPNGVTEKDGHLTWDIDALVFHVKAGIEKARERFGRIESLSVDTWGVDSSSPSTPSISSTRISLRVGWRELRIFS